MKPWLFPLLALVAVGTTGCRVERGCTAGIPEGSVLSYPVARGATFDFPFNEFGYAVTLGGNDGSADRWRLTFLDSTGVLDREFSGFISAGAGFTIFSPFGGASADVDPQDPGRVLIYGGFGSTAPAGVDFDARSFPIGLQAAVDQQYSLGRIYYRDGVTLALCFIDGGQAAFEPY